MASEGAEVERGEEEDSGEPGVVAEVLREVEGELEGEGAAEEAGEGCGADPK